MHRARLLVLKAHPDLAHRPRERILITRFLLGLYDGQLASSLAVVTIQTAADAERLAAEGEAVRRDQRSRRSTSNFLPGGASAQDPDDHTVSSDTELLDEEEEELTEPFGTVNPRKPFNPTGKPQSDKRQRAPQSAMNSVNMVASSPNAPDRTAKGQDASPQGLSSNAYFVRAITLYVTVHHFLQLSKRPHAQDKCEKQSPRSKFRVPRLVHRRPMSQALHSNVMEQQ